MDSRVTIHKLLVANRGEIAIRIARACRELRIQSVLAHSTADARSPAARYFDHVISLGDGESRDTYLDVGKIIDAARSAGANAIHPGYGFLSERGELASACEEAGLIFVGPRAESIAMMGSKATARQLMQKAGVPVVPGYDGDDQTTDRLKAEAGKVGYPLLVKASAGGGGKGMKTVRGEEELSNAIDSARREAQRSFGDGRLILERYLDEPRHIEFQIFGDAHGNLVHLFERDCSVQRRHQKIVEETPAPKYANELRGAMASAAVAAAAAVRYENAGTVEFMVSSKGEFFFLEMNTRLQVEHPVTELVVGVDLVHAQLLVASGHPLAWKQAELSQHGHAIECRIYAEDPDAGFLPQTGTIRCYREPSGPGVRVDSGVDEGSVVSVLYDPLLAKLIVHGESRDSCIDRLVRALSEFTILGTKTNISYLRRIVAHPEFRSANVSTSFIEMHAADLMRHPGEDAVVVAAALSRLARRTPGATVPSGAVAVPTPWDILGGWGRG